MGLGALAILVFVARASRAAAERRDGSWPSIASNGKA
jgi:hypothetical protein